MGDIKGQSRVNFVTNENAPPYKGAGHEGGIVVESVNHLKRRLLGHQTQMIAQLGQPSY